MRHSRAKQKGHNAIQDRLVKCIPKRTTTKPGVRIKVNEGLRDVGDDGGLRPDIVIIDNQAKTATIVDITCPFENGVDAFHIAQRHKEEKYRETAEGLEARGYATTVDALGPDSCTFS
jgi:hypothetical protein